MSQGRKFQLNAQEAKKMNNVLPKGYKLVTPEQFKKRAMIKPKKKTIMGLPVTPQIVNTSISFGLSQNSFLNVPPPPVVQPNPPVTSGRATKNTKFMGIPSLQSIPQSDFYIAPIKSYEKIPISMDYTPSIPRQPQVLSTPVVFSKLKNYPSISQLQKVQPEEYSLSFKDIERKVYVQRDNYKIHQLEADMSKLFLKIYQTYKRGSNEYENTVSIQKYFKSLIKVQKPQTSLPTTISGLNLTRQPSVVSQIKKKPVPRVSDMNTALTIKQKRQLGQRIKKLPSQCLQQICYIIFQNLQNKQYSFDLDTLHVKKIRQLQDYVNSNLDDFSQIKETDDQNNKMGEEEEGQESSFIIEGDGGENDANVFEYTL